MMGFRITGKKGFHITFANGWTVSVQFGPGNYCANRHMTIGKDDELCGSRGSPDAEIAMWPSSGEMETFEEGGTVLGWTTPERVLQALCLAASKPPS